MSTSPVSVVVLLLIYYYYYYYYYCASWARVQPLLSYYYTTVVTITTVITITTITTIGIGYWWTEYFSQGNNGGFSQGNS